MFLKRPWDIIGLFRDLLLELEIMYVHSLEGERYPHYANIIEQERYISKGNFHFASLDALLWRFAVGRDRVRNFIPGREGREKKEGRREEGQKGGWMKQESMMRRWRGESWSSRKFKRWKKIGKSKSEYVILIPVKRFQLCRHCRPVSIA